MVLELSLIRSHLLWGEFSTFYAANAIRDFPIFRSTRYPLRLGGHRQYGMRSLPDTSAHDQQWETNPRPSDLKSNARSTCTWPIKHCEIKYISLNTFRLIVSHLSHCRHLGTWLNCWRPMWNVNYVLKVESIVKLNMSDNLLSEVCLVTAQVHWCFMTWETNHLRTLNIQ